VARTDIGEVAPVHRRDGRHGQALADGYHRGIRAAQPAVRISPHQFGHATQVGVDQFGEMEAITGSHADAVKEHSFGCGPRNLSIM
jgi:hypothetical protein